MTTRRGLLIGIASLVAAPAIVRASSLMPVREIVDADLRLLVAPPAYGVSPGMMMSEFMREMERMMSIMPDWPDEPRFPSAIEQRERMRQHAQHFPQESHSGKNDAEHLYIWATNQCVVSRCEDYDSDAWSKT